MKTPAERQAAFRAKIKATSMTNNTKAKKERLDVLISYDAKLSLKRIAAHKGLTLTGALIEAIMKMDNDLIESFKQGSKERSDYIMTVTR
jgi:uncharacterized protein (DUF1778 family)